MPRHWSVIHVETAELLEALKSHFDLSRLPADATLVGHLGLTTVPILLQSESFPATPDGDHLPVLAAPRRKIKFREFL